MHTYLTEAKKVLLHTFPGAKQGFNDYFHAFVSIALAQITSFQK